jgi:hypothetical protein
MRNITSIFCSLLVLFTFALDVEARPPKDRTKNTRDSDDDSWHEAQSRNPKRRARRAAQAAIQVVVAEQRPNPADEEDFEPVEIGPTRIYDPDILNYPVVTELPEANAQDEEEVHLRFLTYVMASRGHVN